MMTARPPVWFGSLIFLSVLDFTTKVIKTVFIQEKKSFSAIIDKKLSKKKNYSKNTLDAILNFY